MKLFSIFFFLFVFTPKVSAQEYVLPYPGIMPGNKLYVVSQIKERLDEFLYFGNFSKHTLYLKLSDKYLVEAKILFEYKQYLLGKTALDKSNTNIINATTSLDKAKKEGKNISVKRENLDSAKKKHIQILEKIKLDVPQSFEWIPEKSNSTYIKLWEEIDRAILLRK